MQLPALPTEKSFPSALHHPRVATVIGRWLGIAVAVCFLTGLFSHFQQVTPGWLTIPSRPVSLYRVTQGLHVVSGLVAVPLLLAKLWTVYPKLFERPPRSPGRKLVTAMLERLSIAVLVAALALEVFIGFFNTVQWYPWPFPFKETHYALAWIIVGALLVHLAVKLPLIVAHWRRRTATVRSATVPPAPVLSIVRTAARCRGTKNSISRTAAPRTATAPQRRRTPCCARPRSCHWQLPG
jgi:hypothetical protein